MGIKERREREKRAIREAILTASLEIAQQEGWLALTIRKVGERIEYSAPMVYEYFASKDAILLELLQEGFRQLTIILQRASIATEHPEEQVQKIADAYWQFAFSNPELYQLMHGLAGVPLNRDVIAQAVQEVCMITREALLNWAREQGFTLPDPEGATEIAWCLVHSLVSLALVNRIEGGEQRAKDLMHRALQSQLVGWYAIHKNA